MASFVHREEIARAPVELFAWFLRPAQASEILRASRLELLEGPEVLVPGALMTWRTRRYGLSQKILQRVEVVEEPTRLVVVQTRGPLKSYRLEQHFQATEAGTLLTEEIDFEPPGGVLGQLLTESAVRAEFAELYRLRGEAFRERGWLVG
jgi:ligand-binding SRPBCC domain-containing protein